MMKEFDNTKLQRAKDKVKMIKGFYVHLGVYLLINIIILINIIYHAGWDGILSFSTLFTPFFWGIGLSAHFAKVFGYDFFFGKDWEQKKINEIIEKEKKESEEFLRK